MRETCALIVGSGWGQLSGSGTGRVVVTPFGAPSASIHERRLAGHSVLTLARHGDAHTIPPHKINYRANVIALKELGAQVIIGLNTVGLISEVSAPGRIAVPDQVIDYTWGREHTLCDGSQADVEHIDFTLPFAPTLRTDLVTAAIRAGVDCCDGGTYAATQGPRLETAAEVDRLERDGADFIGMTAMPEAAIAREAGIDYACIALVVNRAAGRGDEPIHAAVEAHTQAARDATLATLEAFFAAL